MVCEVPIVATNVGGVSNLIQDGENGLLVNPSSPREICEAVKRIVSDPELRKRLVTNGLATVKSHTLQAERDRMMVQIKSLLGEDLGRTERTT